MASYGDIKRGMVGILIASIFIITFFLLRPIIIPIIFGLLFAYIFNPVYKIIQSKFKRKNFSAFIILFSLIAIIAIPLFYIVPLLVNQVFEIYVSLQSFNFNEFIGRFIQTDFSSTLASNLDNIIGKIFSTFLSQFTDMLVNLPSILLQLAVFFFTFFFAIRDSDELKEYISTLSPFSKTTESKFLKEFRGITNAIIFGQVFIGLIQGLALGAGLFFLGINKVVVLTFLAIVASIIPMVGSWLVWLPVALFLLASGNMFDGIFLLLYGSLFISTLDNLLRPYILSKRSNLPVALSVIGTIGGLYLFGIAGLILGPLIFAYVLIIIEFYRDGKLKELFNK